MKPRFRVYVKYVSEVFFLPLNGPAFDYTERMYQSGRARNFGLFDHFHQVTFSVYFRTVPLGYFRTASLMT